MNGSGLSRFVPASVGAVTFCDNFPAAKKRNLELLYNDVMSSAKRRLKWQEAEERANKVLSRTIIDQWTHLLMISIAGAICSSCRKPCYFKWPRKFANVESFLRFYVEDSLKMRPWASESHKYYPTDIEVKQFIATLVLNFFSANSKDDCKVFCSDRACEAKGFLVIPLEKMRNLDEFTKNNNGNDSSEALHDDKKAKKNDSATQYPTPSSFLASASNSTVALTASSFAVSMSEEHIEKGQVLSFGDSRCMWIEIKQHDMNDQLGFSIIFARWSGNEAFLMPLLTAIDKIPFASLTTSTPEARRQRMAYRLHYQYDLKEDRLINYAEVLDRTEYCTAKQGYKPHQIHHFAHLIKVPFHVDLIKRKTDGKHPTILEILQTTHTMWLNGLDESMKKRYEKDFEQQLQKQKEKREKERAGLTVQLSSSGNTVLKSVTLAPDSSKQVSISESYSQTMMETQKTAHVNKYFGAISKLVGWLTRDTLESVRCAEPTDSQGFPMPQLFFTLPFLFFLHAHCDLVIAGMAQQSVAKLFNLVTQCAFDDFWSDEVETLRMINSATHIDEHCANPRNLVGIVRGAKPYVLKLPIDVICAVDGFVQMYEREFPLLRQMLVGTRLRLVVAQ